MELDHPLQRKGRPLQTLLTLLQIKTQSAKRLDTLQPDDVTGGVKTVSRIGALEGASNPIST